MVATVPTRPLRIAFIHQPWSVIHPPVNGADSVALVIEETARRLAREVESVTAYCRLGADQKAVEQYGGVEYRRTSVSIDRWAKLIAQQFDRLQLRNPQRPFFSSALCYRQFIHGVIDDLARQRCDIVHIHNFSQFVPIIRARLPKVKIVLQMHCEWLNQLDARMIENRLEAADLVLGVSEFLAAKLRARFPQLGGKCRRVYNGADVPDVQAPPEIGRGHKQVLYVGRLSPEKGVHVLLESFKQVYKRHPDAQLSLIGPIAVVPYEMIIPFSNDPLLLAMKDWYRRGSYGDWLCEQISQFPPGTVSLYDAGLPHDQLATHYRAATVFVAPSIWEEPFGLPLVEAMASGTACIASDGGAFPEILDHGNAGRLVPRGDVCALADAIDQLLTSESRRSSFADAGHRRARALFTWDCAANSLLGEYSQLLN